MTNFNVGDKIAFNRQSKNGMVYQRLNAGTIIKGPFMVDGINHYQIKWDKVTPNQSPGATEIELISPINSTKYGWSKI